MNYLLSIKYYIIYDGYSLKKKISRITNMYPNLLDILDTPKNFLAIYTTMMFHLERRGRIIIFIYIILEFMHSNRVNNLII